MIRYERLERDQEDLHRQYQGAQPYPHIVLDDFLDPSVAETACRRFPSMASMAALKTFRVDKAQDPLLDKFDPIFRQIVFEHLHSARFVRFISCLTGIPCLRHDPQLYTGGLAQGANGSFLSVHVDNSSHPVQGWYRRVNILIYLNRDWGESCGGHFEIWDHKMRSCKSVLPIFNRALIFSASRLSWHGYRTVTAANVVTRESINVVYFTAESPTGRDYYHVTAFRARPGETRNRWLFPLDNAARTLWR